jgi:hypothetical protein
LNTLTFHISKEEIMSQRIFVDPVTNELVLPSGRRIPGIVGLPIIAGGSAMNTDEIEVDDPTKDPEDDDDDDDRRRRLKDDDDDDDDTKGGDDDWTPPDKVQWERMRSALRNERRDRKRVQREYEEKVQNLTSTASATNEVEVEKARISERNARDAYWAEEIVRARATAEFAAQGATAEMAERLAFLVNLKKVEWDEREREWDGLQEEIDDIVESNQEFFRTKARDDDRDGGRRGGVSRPRVDGAGRGREGGGAPRRKPSSAQLLAQQALGTGSRRRRG